MFQSSSTAGCAMTIITAVLVPQRSVIRSNRTGGGGRGGRDVNYEGFKSRGTEMFASKFKILCFY